MKKQLSPMIKNLLPELTELGKIKIGKKGHTKTSGTGKTFQLPQKLSHFLITTLERDDTDNFIVNTAIHEMISAKTGEPADKITRIPIFLMFDDINLNFQSRYVMYKGKTLQCSGDGEAANWQGNENTVVCPCERSGFNYTGNEKCKMNGMLSVIVQGASSIGGAWKLRTTSRHSIQGIYSSLMLLSRITGGVLAGIDLDLVLVPKISTTPQGATQTIYVVGIEFSKGTTQELRDESMNILRSSNHYRNQMHQIEADATKVLTAEIIPDDVEAYQEEFVPEQVEGYVAPETVPPPPLDLNAAVEPTAAETTPVLPNAEPEPPVDTPPDMPPERPTTVNAQATRHTVAPRARQADAPQETDSVRDRVVSEANAYLAERAAQTPEDVPFEDIF